MISFTLKHQSIWGISNLVVTFDDHEYKWGEFSIQFSKTESVIYNKGNLVLHFQTSKKNEMSLWTNIMITNLRRASLFIWVFQAANPRDLVKKHIIDFHIQKGSVDITSTTPPMDLFYKV